MQRASTLLTLAVCGGLVLASVALRWRGETFVYDTWSDRDLVRARHFFELWPTTGPEVSFGDGVRIPGALLYFLWGVPTVLGATPLDVFRFQTAFDVLGAFLLFEVGRRTWGPTAGAVAAAVVSVGDVPIATNWHLWNPGMVPLFTSVAWAAVTRGAAMDDARFLPVGVVAFAAAAQLHLASLLPAAGVLVTVLVARPAGIGRALVVSAVGVLVLYTPYLLGEIGTDFRNMRALLEVVFEQESHVDGWSPSAVLQGVRLLGMRGDPLGWGDVLPAPALIFTNVPWLCVVVAGVGALPAHGPERRAWLLLGGLIGTWLLLLGFASSAQQLGSESGNERYILPLMPAVALVLGGSVELVLRRFDARSVAAGLGARASLVTGLLLQGLAALGTAGMPGAAGPFAFVAQVRMLEEVRAATGWSLPDTVARLSVAMPDEEGWRTYPEFALQEPVDRVGLPFPGSAAPPCALVLADGGGVVQVDAATIDDALGYRLPDVAILRVASVSAGTLVVYDHRGGRCPVGAANRYLRTPLESFARLEAPPAGRPPERRDWEGRSVWLSRLDLYVSAQRIRAQVAVEVHEDGCRARVTVRSPQLSGSGMNVGSLGPIFLEDVVVVAVDGASERSALVASHLGQLAAATPITVEVELGGPADIELRGRARPATTDGPRSGVDGQAFSLLVARASGSGCFGP